MHHEQDIRKWADYLGTLTYSLMLIGSLSLMGIPPYLVLFKRSILLAANERVGDLSELIYWFLNIGVIVQLFTVQTMLLVFTEDLASIQKTCTEGVTNSCMVSPLVACDSLNIPQGVACSTLVINNFLQQEIFVWKETISYRV